MTLETRKCNWLESVFASANVRFVAGVDLKEMKPIGEVRSAVAAAMKCIGGAHVSSLDPPTLARGEDNELSTLSIREEPTASRTLRQLVGANIAQDMPALGGPIVTLHQDDAASTETFAIVINTNHALMDAITVKKVLLAIKTCLEQPTSSPPGTSQKEDGSTQDPLVPFAMTEWYDALATPAEANNATWHAIKMQDETNQKFLPWGEQTTVTAAECLGANNSATAVGGGDSLTSGQDRSQLNPGEIVLTVVSEKVKQGLATARSYGTTWTGLWMACLSCSIAERYFKSASSDDRDTKSSCCVGISTLVDLRRCLPAKQLTEGMLQMQSTVTVATTWDREACAKLSVSDSGDANRDLLLTRAKFMTDQLKARINRGEAHRQAKAFSTGDLANEAAPIEATIELSNHGIYASPRSVEVAQRFDGYEGLSIIIHSESGTGDMKITASFGQNVDSRMCGDFLHRTVEFLEVVVATASAPPNSRTD